MEESQQQIVLVVDDEESVRFTLTLSLKKICKVMEAQDRAGCLNALFNNNIDLILLDINLQNSSGIDVLREIKEYDPGIDVIMLTAVDDYGTAIKTLNEGAYDYITKPFNVKELQSLVERVLEKRSALDKNAIFLHNLEISGIHKHVVAKDNAMVNLLRKAAQVARSNSPILISGESGCGKEVLARYIHEQSPRSGGPFVPINCGGIPENLLEAELFGYEKGAFTGASCTKIGKLECASNGTIFLDEIGTMSQPMQVKLLRALQEMRIERLGGNEVIPIDVRIISATNIDLTAAIKNNVFREDLYFRLNVVAFHIPVLRDRRDDINVLLDYFIDYFSIKTGKQKIIINSIIREVLENYSWPGNIRELRNLIESFYALYDGGAEITFSCLPQSMLMHMKDSSGADNGEDCLPLKEAVDHFEREYILKILKKFDGNQSKAAKYLNIHRNTLMQKYSQASKKE